MNQQDARRILDNLAVCLELAGDDRMLNVYVSKALRRCTTLVTEQALTSIPAKRLAKYGVTQEEYDMAMGNQKIAAIKSVRNRRGISLKEAKDVIDNLIFQETEKS